MRLIPLMLGVGLLFPMLTAETAEYGFRIQHAWLACQGDVVALSAKVKYRFSPSLVKALRHGVPLTLTVVARIRQPRQWFWDKTLWRRQLDFRIRYYPLARAYQVVDETNRFQRSFPRLDAALAALGELQEIALPVTEGWKFPPHAYGEVMVHLDIGKLPWALRPQAYFSSRWRMRSPPYRWPLSG